MTDGLDGHLTDRINEALTLRFQDSDVPALELGATAILESLRAVRQRLDRVEVLLASTMRLRARFSRRATAAQAEADDAWDEAARKARSAPVAQGGEYTSAKERHAEANLVAFGQRRTARDAVEDAHRCDEAVDVIRLAHRGLEAIRQDHLAVLRALQFESSLDR